MLSDIHNVVEISDLTVKQLKEILFINRVDFKGCVEKEELTKKVIDLWAHSRREGTFWTLVKYSNNCISSFVFRQLIFLI